MVEDVERDVDRVVGVVRPFPGAAGRGHVEIVDRDAATLLARNTGCRVETHRERRAVGRRAANNGKRVVATSDRRGSVSRGGDFVTSGAQNIRVGDNPGGRERVTVTPLSSPNVNGPRGGDITINMPSDTIIIQGSADQDTVAAFKRNKEEQLSETRDLIIELKASNQFPE